MVFHLTLSFLTLTGLTGSGQSPPYRSAKRSARAPPVHRQQRGGKDPGSGQVQAERGPKSHPGWHV